MGAIRGQSSMNRGLAETMKMPNLHVSHRFTEAGKPVFSRARFRARLVPIENRLHRMCHRPAFWCFRLGQGTIDQSGDSSNAVPFLYRRTNWLTLMSRPPTTT